jgi:hypothetical protein
MWGEDEITVKDVFPDWGIFFPSQMNLALNKGVIWMGLGSDVLGYLEICAGRLRLRVEDHWV